MFRVMLPPGNLDVSRCLPGKIRRAAVTAYAEVGCAFVHSDARRGLRLAITNLQVSFGERRVVDLAALAVLGLAHTVGARVSGSIRLDGAELTGLSHREMREVRGRRIAAIFQSPAMAFSPVF